jgi:ABC-type branched-subunit amino acid transport system substrate-binding protein
LQATLLHWREIISEPCSTAQESAAKDGDAVIKVGAVVATRGRAALLGNSFVKAIQLAKEELTNTTHQYQLVIEEITSPDKAESAIEKLIETDKVDALVVGLSISGQIAKSYATAAKIPLFCICSVGDIGDELYTFTTMPLAEDEASRLVDEAKRRDIENRLAYPRLPEY